MQRPKDPWLVKKHAPISPGFFVAFLAQTDNLSNLPLNPHCERSSYVLSNPAQNLRLHHHSASTHLVDKSQPIQSAHQNNMRHHRSGARTHSPRVARSRWPGHIALCRHRHHLVHHIPDLAEGHNLSSEQQPPTSRILIPILLTGLSGLPPLSIDMFLPSMPAMVREFQTQPTHIQPAVTLFLMALGAAQLVFGPLSDRYGRRPILLIGLACYALAGLGCLFAPTVGALILARVLQGFAGGSGPSVSRAVVRDIYGEIHAARIMSYMATAIALAPILAPIIGGFLQTYFGWQAVFVVLSALGTLFFFGYLWAVPETNNMIDPTALNPTRMIANYRDLLSSRQYLGYTFMVAILFWGMFAFITNSSFVLITELSVSPQLYGFCFGSVAVGLMIGAFLSGRLNNRLGSARIIQIGSLIAAGAGLLLLGLKLAGVFSVITIIAPMCLFTIGGGMVRPQAMPAQSCPTRKSRTRSALMGFIQMSTAGLFVTLFSQFYSASSLSMVTAIAISGIIALLVRRTLLPSGATP